MSDNITVEQPLFKTSTKYSFDEYKKFTDAVYKYVYKMNYKLIGFSLILIVAFFITKRFEAIMAAILFPAFFIFFRNRKIKETYESNRCLKDNFSVFNFYDDHFEQTNSISHSNIKYCDIYLIVETNTNIYIMVAKNEGYILIKEQCPENIINFFNDKCNGRVIHSE